MAKAKKKGRAGSQFHIENVTPIIRQKGDLIKVTMTCQFDEKVWNSLGTLIGKMALVEMLESDAPPPEVEKQDLDFDEDEGED